MSLEELKRMAQELASEDRVGRPPKAPFPRLFISYDPEVAPGGQFALGGEKDETGAWATPPTVLGREIDVVFLKEYGQYVYFDPSLERVTIRSDIFTKWNAREARDLVTGEPISKLKEVYGGIKYTQLTLILVKNKEGEWHPAIWYMRGAVLKAYLDIIREARLRPQEYIATKIFHLGIESKKRGSVKYYVPMLVGISEPNETEAKILLELIPQSVGEFKAYVIEYNKARKPASPPTEETTEETDEEGILDDELPIF